MLVSQYWYFITISLDTDFILPDKLHKRLSDDFNQYSYAVYEKGSSGKQHFHMIGLYKEKMRMDNYKRSLSSLLEKAYDISKYSIDIVSQQSFEGKLAYLHKEPDRVVLWCKGFSTQCLKAAEELCVLQLRKVEQRLSNSKKNSFKMNEFANKCIEQGISDELGIRRYLKDARDNGEMAYSDYRKLGLKTFIAYVSGMFDN